MCVSNGQRYATPRLDFGAPLETCRQPRSRKRRPRRSGCWWDEGCQQPNTLSRSGGWTFGEIDPDTLSASSAHQRNGPLAGRGAIRSRQMNRKCIRQPFIGAAIAGQLQVFQHSTLFVFSFWGEDEGCCQFQPPLIGLVSITAVGKNFLFAQEADADRFFRNRNRRLRSTPLDPPRLERVAPFLLRSTPPSKPSPRTKKLLKITWRKRRNQREWYRNLAECVQHRDSPWRCPSENKGKGTKWQHLQGRQTRLRLQRIYTKLTCSASHSAIHSTVDCSGSQAYKRGMQPRAPDTKSIDFIPHLQFRSHEDRPIGQRVHENNQQAGSLHGKLVDRIIDQWNIQSAPLELDERRQLEPKKNEKMRRRFRLQVSDSHDWHWTSARTTGRSGRRWLGPELLMGSFLGSTHSSLPPMAVAGTEHINSAISMPIGLQK